MVTAPARRVLVRDMPAQGVSERRALAKLRMSASSLRYTPAPDTNAALRTRIVALAHRHRRSGAGMIYLKLRQAGEPVNHKRVVSSTAFAGRPSWCGTQMMPMALSALRSHCSLDGSGDSTDMVPKQQEQGRS